ncbi:hypothetical protein CNMCM8927_006076 [Aspergillus lentulus]|uniref:Calcium channel YVC1-like C-terminal transmembrane domain-containing protein n=1 Tax=Aspergillus lentulus TaxID=293939 RepID=A0AAN6BPI3_ASPLE|nr:hypothetical protein CNMCM6069_006162 [Aspergillus lentulus]KAF4177037.1 hypothetical protein CNMCM8060_005805 [Aspergillus lentulus]KAF4185932.1 hypothetical protein CNMCM7927_006110 [Aspergillus lentulus]KAF4194329.1 hypothetical protein CNMCM8694_007715 [Aspergillus lentulus]KAF4205576.1 hypothetical protein CNMCM8927_006076 [Aspergillus lentulus]
MAASATDVLPTSDEYPEIPIIDDNESLAEVIRKLGNYLNVAVPDVACTFEQLRSSAYGHKLRLLIGSLAENSHNPWIISALMILKWQLNNEDNDSDWGLNESRGYACEYIAWQFLCHLTRREMIDVLLDELPSPRRDSATISQAEQGTSGLGPISHEDEGNETEGERTPLLLSSSSSLYRFFVGKSHRGDSCAGDNRGSRGWYYDDPELHSFSPFFGLNALEIATIAHAKKFLSQKAVQRVIDDIWNGEIVFWDSLSVHSKKKPQFFNKRTADPYSRLRVPMYRKAFEAAFFVSFLFLYYAVLVERKPTGIGIFETLLYVWIAAFAYDELSGIVDAGMLFYQMDFWSLWNMGIIAIGLAFVIARIVGLAKESDYITDLSFDILSLEALFLVPRQGFSYHRRLIGASAHNLGTLGYLLHGGPPSGIHTDKLLRIDTCFERDGTALNISGFLPVVVVLYIGFLTTFTMLARDRLSLRQMSWILVKVFFGSSVLGFDIAYDNLIPLLCIRPLRLLLSAGHIRRVRIVLLRATHLPFVALIWAFESSRRYVSQRNNQFPPTQTTSTSSIQANFPFSTRHAPVHASTVDTSQLGCGKSKGSSNAAQHAEARGVCGLTPNQAGRNDLADMIDELERLRTQVERVAATVAFHQRNRL